MMGIYRFLTDPPEMKLLVPQPFQPSPVSAGDSGFVEFGARREDDAPM